METLKRWYIVRVVWEFGKLLCFVILKDAKVFDLDDFILLFNVDFVDCVSIIAY